MVKDKNQANTRRSSSIPWDIQLAMTEKAMTEQNYQDVIGLSTESLDELMETHVLRLLELRATAYEKKGFISRALEDAMRMIQYVPTSPVGYFKAGWILMTYGKSSLAVDYYKEGLRAVPQSHHQYEEMQEECAKATTRAQKRYDIIGKLPRELVYKVLTNLGPERVWVCLKVSKRWCEQVSRCGTWWSTVIVKQTGTEIDQVVCDAIPLVKGYIQQLELANLSSSELGKKYLMHLKYGVFINIKILSLKGAFFRELLSEDLAIALWQIRGTLTSLKVDFGSGKPFPLFMILGSCPSITELCYTTTDDISVWKGGAGYGSKCKRLSNLELCYRSMTHSTLYSHLAVCPNLQRLILMSLEAKILDSNVSTPFIDHCPRLKILGLNYTEGLPGVDTCDDITDEKGVAYISVEFRDHLPPIAEQIISGQLHSLQRLNIRHKKCDIQQRYMQPYIASITCSKLSALQYTYHTETSSAQNLQYDPYGCTRSVQQYVGAIIEGSPLLMDLSLFGGPYLSTYIQTPLERAVKTKVRSLTLDSVSFCGTNTTWYNSFFSSLDWVHALILHKIDLGVDKLRSLATSKSIRQLTITRCTGITDISLTEFFERVTLESTHQLNTLNINNIPISMENSTIQFLVKISRLETLMITDCKNISAELVNYLIACAPTSCLKTIEIVDCFPTDIAVSWSDSVHDLVKKGVTLSIR